MAEQPRQQDGGDQHCVYSASSQFGENQLQRETADDENRRQDEQEMPHPIIDRRSSQHLVREGDQEPG